MAQNCVALVPIFGRLASAMIASTGVVLTCPVIAHPANHWHVSSFSILEDDTYGSHAAAAYSTADLPAAMKVARNVCLS